MLLVWLKFIACALMILFAGIRLTKYGDILAEKTGLGRAWIGIVLLATITSLPEVANGISSVVFVDAPNLAVGNVFGANFLNMFTIVTLDVINNLRGKGSLLRRVSSGQIIPLSFAVMLMSIAGAGIILSKSIAPFSFLGVGVFTILIAVIYLSSERIIFKHEKKVQEEYVKEKGKILKYGHVSMLEAVLKFLFCSVIVVAAGTWLPHIGVQIAALTGWGTTFVGTLFVSIATTTPELVVSVSALYLGAIDMSIGNLTGSNLFNMIILFIDDIFYQKGPVLANVSQNHIITAFFVILMMSIVIISIIYKSERRVFKIISVNALMLAITYLTGIYILFNMRILQ
ncbi:MAG: sodium:calcium antiporter [Candidatus Saganbacteria bacterium]|nr:sodium:calcium antiporter [Candidatus Saganbacteria bacterium]